MFNQSNTFQIPKWFLGAAAFLSGLAHSQWCRPQLLHNLLGHGPWWRWAVKWEKRLSKTWKEIRKMENTRFGDGLLSAFAVILHPRPCLEEPWSSVLHFPALAAISYQDLADRSCHYDALCSEIPTPQHQIQPQKHKKPWFISYFLAVVQALTSGQQSFCSATHCKGCRQKLLQTNLLSRRPQWQLLVEGWVRTVAWLWHTVTFYLESWLGNHPPFESLRIQIRPENGSAAVSVKSSRRGRAKHPLFWSRFRILAFCEVSLPRRKSSRLVMMSSFAFVCSPYDFPKAFKFKCHGFHMLRHRSPAIEIQHSPQSGPFDLDGLVYWFGAPMFVLWNILRMCRVVIFDLHPPLPHHKASAMCLWFCKAPPATDAQVQHGWQGWQGQKVS